MIKKLPDEVIQAWKERQGPLVMTTVSKEGAPNAIYASIVNMLTDGRIAIADNYFDKTKANIDTHGKASALFITKDHKSYQVKGSIEYCSEGPLFQEMLTWADPKHPRKGVAVINSEEVYQGAKRIA